VVHVAGARLSVFDFQREALTALGADVTLLRARPLPADSSLARDTSLDCSHLTRLTRIVPLGVRAALSSPN
jgi:hypothetical protein